jgi:hypothetical protein
MNIPYELLFGVDVAIKKLRPGANFQLDGTNFTKWNCPDNSEPPTWAEVTAQMQADELAANKWLAENTQNP